MTSATYRLFDFSDVGKNKNIKCALNFTAHVTIVSWSVEFMRETVIET